MFSPGISFIFLLKIWDVEQINAPMCPILSTLLMSAGSSSGLRGQTRPSPALHVPPGPSTSVESTATPSDAAQRWIWGEVGHRMTRAWHVTQTSAATHSTTLWGYISYFTLKYPLGPAETHTLNFSAETSCSFPAQTQASVLFYQNRAALYSS